MQIRTLMLRGDNDLVSLREIIIKRPRKVLSKLGRAAPERDLVRTRGVEQLTRRLARLLHALRRGHRHRVISTELHVRVQEIVRYDLGDGREALRAAGIVGVDV
jgi:DNA-binding NarL/FixJ family response regulator